MQMLMFVLLLAGQFSSRISARVTDSILNSWTEGGEGEDDRGSLIDRSAQIIKQQDAEEGERWEETAWSPQPEENKTNNDTLCPKPLPPENGYIRGTDYNDGGVVHVVCEEGYRLKGPGKLTCVPVPYPGAPGVWLPQDEYHCLPAQPSVIEIHTLGGGHAETGPSYVIVNDNHPHDIGENHQIREDHTSFENIRCPPPSPPPHGHLEGTDYSLYATVGVTCDEGYTLIGPDHMTCLPVPDLFHHAGIWEPHQAPSCHAPPPSTLPMILIQQLAATRISSQQSSHRRTDTHPDATQLEGLPVKCSLPKVIGPCRAAIPRFYFNTTLMECLPFKYGGCHGNDNNFHTISECQTDCH